MLHSTSDSYNAGKSIENVSVSLTESTENSIDNQNLSKQQNQLNVAQNSTNTIFSTTSQLENNNSKRIQITREEHAIWKENTALRINHFQRENAQQIRMKRNRNIYPCSTSTCLNTKAADLICKEKNCPFGQLPACFACFAQQHKAENINHMTHVVTFCPHCQIDLAEVFCYQCNLLLCKACFSNLHTTKITESHRAYGTHLISAQMVMRVTWSKYFPFRLNNLQKNFSPGKRKHQSNEEIEVISIGDSDEDEDRNLDDENEQAKTTGDPQIGQPVQSTSAQIEIQHSQVIDGVTSLAAMNANSVEANNVIQPIPYIPTSVNTMPYSTNGQSFPITQVNHNYTGGLSTPWNNSQFPNAYPTLTVNVPPMPINRALIQEYDRLNEIVFSHGYQIKFYTHIIQQNPSPSNLISTSTQLQHVTGQFDKACEMRDNAVAVLILNSSYLMSSIRSLSINHLTDISQVQKIVHENLAKFSRNKAILEQEIKTLQEQLRAINMSAATTNFDSFYTSEYVNNRLQESQQKVSLIENDQMISFVNLVQYSIRIRKLLTQKFNLRKRVSSTPNVDAAIATQSQHFPSSQQANSVPQGISDRSQHYPNHTQHVHSSEQAFQMQHYENRPTSYPVSQDHNHHSEVQHIRNTHSQEHEDDGPVEI